MRHAGRLCQLATLVLPIFFTSCVTGIGLNLLYTYFNEISPKLDQGNRIGEIANQSSELQVDETFEVPGIGVVVSGLVMQGIIRECDEMLIGPNDQGEFSSVSIVSLQRHKIPCNFARAGQKCTMAIAAKNVKVRKGMVMKELEHEWKYKFSVCLEFKAKVKFIDNELHKLCQRNQISVYVGNVRQTCIITSAEPMMPSENSFIIGFKLTKRPEYIREGSHIIIRHGLSKGVGRVCSVKNLFSDKEI